jgi:L,D-transpeptidase catalytic domain
MWKPFSFFGERLLMMNLLRARLAFVALLVGLLAMSGVAHATKVLITINKVSQKMTVKVDGETEYVWLVSTGAGKFDTPSGTYRPFRMEKTHFSKEWDDAPMPNSMFFTGRGHAIHGSFHVKSLGRKASHGCVRLAPENAAKLYALVQKSGMSNTTIVLRGGLFDGGGFDRELEDITNSARNLKKKAKRRLFMFGKALDGST